MRIKHPTALFFETFGGNKSIRNILTELELTYYTEDFLSNFWGTRYIVKKPKGRGSTVKTNQLYKRIEPFAREVFFPDAKVYFPR